MKRWISTLLAVVMVFSLTACGGSSSETQVPESTTGAEGAVVGQSESMAENISAEESQTDTASEETEEQEDSVEEKNILVAYFSRAGENYRVGDIEKGNTAIIAEMIADIEGADLFEIATVTPYPEGYDECTDVAWQEQEDNARPVLSESVTNMERYDIVFVGYPIWWGDMPMAVYTFLESYDFSGKTVIPFCTHGGSGLADTQSKIAGVCPNSTVLEGLAVSGETAQNSESEAGKLVDEWLDMLFDKE